MTGYVYMKVTRLGLGAVAHHLRLLCRTVAEPCATASADPMSHMADRLMRLTAVLSVLLHLCLVLHHACASEAVFCSSAPHGTILVNR